jgi:hypothetical protein
MIKNILTAVVLVAIVYISSVIYISTSNKSYIDTKYGFKISNQSGWSKPAQKTSAYYSLGTPDKAGKTIVSSFNVNPIKREGTDDQKFKIFQDFCKDAASEGIDKKFTVSDVDINNLTGYLCEYENIPTNVNSLYRFKMFFLLNQNKNYDFVISESFPKDDLIEEAKVNEIINNFFAL